MIKLVGVILALTLCSIGHGSTITGKVFKMKTDLKEQLFNFKSVITEANGVQKSESTYTDMAGNVVVVETSEREGTKLKNYQIDHKQTGRKGSIVVDGKKVIFNFEENGKKKSEEKEDLPENFIIGHTLAPFVLSKWPDLMGGKTLDIRFGVWDRQETVGFSISKVGQEKLAGNDVVLIRFKPSSFIIAALVDPIIFKFTPDGKSLMGIVGRTLPRQKVGDKWKDLDAEVLLTHEP